MKTWDEAVLCAEYSQFSVGPESTNYRLIVSGYNDIISTAGHSMGHHDRMEFTTFDRDNDNGNGNCANYFRGGWWFNNCRTTVPTGYYYTGGQLNSKGVTWHKAYNNDYSFKEMVLAIHTNQ